MYTQDKARYQSPGDRRPAAGRGVGGVPEEGGSLLPKGYYLLFDHRMRTEAMGITRRRRGGREGKRIYRLSSHGLWSERKMNDSWWSVKELLKGPKKSDRLIISKRRIFFHF